MKSSVWCACSVIAVMCATASPAIAQETATEPQAATTSEEVVVTGSRLIRGDYSSVSPIVTVTAETLQDAGSAGSVGAGLSQLPQFTPTATAAGSPSFPNRLGQSLLNPRGLGPERYLLLLDGRRIQPSNSDGTVDVNFVPSNLLQSVETITGGASAAYGSDAITGVVNLRLRSDVEGLELYAQYNQPELGAGDSENVNLIWGDKLRDDRGSILLSFDYTRMGDPLFSREQSFYNISRTNGALPLAVVNFGANQPTASAVNTVFEGYGAAPGSINNTRPIGVNYDGTLFTAAPLTSPVFNYKGPGDEANVVNVGNQLLTSAGREYTLTVPLDRYNGFGRLEYNVTNDIQVFGEVFYTHGEADVPIGFNGFGLSSRVGTVPATNPFIPDDLATLLASRGNPNGTFNVNYLFTSLPRITFTTTTDVAQIVGGVSGAIPSLDWHWDVYGTYGRTSTDQVINGMSGIAAQQLLEAPDGGASLCEGGLNIFGPPSGISQSCLDYIGRSGTTESDFSQSVIEATLRGGLFTLPAGELEFAAGVARRRNTFSSVPSEIFRIGDLIPQSVSLPAGGAQSVNEGFIEILAPLLRGAPLARAVNLDIGYRYSDYRTFGGVSAYNAGLDWEITPSLRFRGSYARAIRAPSLADLYTPESTVQALLGTPSATNSNGDPCDIRSSFRNGANAPQVRALCLAQGVPSAIIDSYTFVNTTVFPTARGNLDLDPEVADTYTAGFVWRSQLESPLLERLQVSLDYYNIRVEDAIGVLPFTSALTNCFNADNFSNPGYDQANRFCAVVVRNAAGQISSASLSPRINQASYATSGVDVQVDWAAGLGALGLDDRYGEINVNFVGSWLESFLVQPFENAAELDFAGASSGSIVASVLPEWKSVLRLTYSLNDVDIGLRWRHLAGVQDVSRVTTVGSTTPGVDAVDYFDLSGAWDVTEKLTLRAGVNNVLNHDIPQVGTVQGNTDPNTYDVIGRSYYVGLGVRF